MKKKNVAHFENFLEKFTLILYLLMDTFAAFDILDMLSRVG